MGKKRYKFNPKTLTYEVITLPFRLRFYLLLRKLVIGIILALIVNIIFSFFFYTPKISEINRHNREIEAQYDLLKTQLDRSIRKIAAIRERDNMVYRIIFATDTLEMPGVWTPYPDERYAPLQGDRYSPLMTGVWQRMDLFAKLLYIETVSFDEIHDLTQNKERMAESIPAIWPINRRHVQGSIGAFGMRFHPISHRYAMHTGMDFGSRTGTAVYATGNGKVDFETGTKSGYGRQVLLNHGFGYKTRYAHLSRVSVVPGQTVRRGEKIGEVGNTGRSTGSHLHYEVIYQGKPMNPVNFMRRDMTSEELQKIIESAKTSTYEL